MTMALLLTATLKLWVTVEAGQRLATDREARYHGIAALHAFDGGGFPARRLFDTTPPVSQAAARRAGRAGGFDDPLSLTHNSEYHWLPWVAGIIILPLDIIALALVGIWTALFCKTHTRATLATVQRVLVAPWVGYGLVMIVVAGLRELNYLRDDDTPVSVLIGIWFFFGIVADAYFGWRAWTHLRSDFRDLAMQRYGLRARRMAKAREAHKATLRWRPLTAATACVAAIACIAWVRSRPAFPPPVLVTLTSSSAPIRAYPSGRWGMFLILPDGSLWRWGEAPEGPLFPRTSTPVQVGSFHDWVKVQVRPSMRVVGLRANGTIWEWGVLPGGDVTQGTHATQSGYGLERYRRGK